MNRLGPRVMNTEIAGALARFWSRGSGPTHAEIGTALALAGFEEMDGGVNVPKEQRVLQALRRADHETAVRLVEELLSILRSRGLFDGPALAPAVIGLGTALERNGHGLAPGGYVTWASVAGGGGSQHPAEASAAGIQGAPASGDQPHGGPTTSGMETTVPSVELLVSSLRRLASALRPLAVRRRSKPSLAVRDEYDMQDVVEMLLRSFCGFRTKATPRFGTNPTPCFGAKRPPVSAESDPHGGVVVGATA